MNVSGSGGGTRAGVGPDVVYMNGLIGVAGGGLTGSCAGVYNCDGIPSRGALSQPCGVGLCGIGGMSDNARVSFANAAASGGGALNNPVTSVAIRVQSAGATADCCLLP